MKTHHRDPASISATSPARSKIRARLHTKTMPVFAIGLFAILSIAAGLRVEADSPSIAVTDANTQVTGDLNITGNLLKNGVPWTPSGASIVEAVDALNAAALSLQNPGILYVVPKTETTDGSVWFAGKLIVGTQPAVVLLTPAMTSNTAPAPFVASASSHFNDGTADGNAPWCAFDQVKTSDGTHQIGWMPLSGKYPAPNYMGNEWLMIDLGNARTLVKYTLHNRGGSASSADVNNFPKTFTLYGSMDGINFFEIETRTNIPTPTSFYQPFDFTLIAPVQARYLRWNITQSQAALPSIGEIELYGY